MVSRGLRSSDASTASRRLRASKRTWRRLTPYAFLAPTIVALGLGNAIPVAIAVRLSFYHTSLAAGDEQFVGLNNYREILHSPEFVNSLTVTAKFTLTTVIGSVAIGLGLALLMNGRFRGRSVVRSLLLIPWAMPLVPTAMIWRWLLNPTFGLISWFAQSVGRHGSPEWLQDPALALIAVIVIQIWQLYPLAMVLYLAGLQNIPHDLYEAARVDGAGPWRAFLHITVPSVSGITVVLSLLISLWAFGRTFTIIFLLTAGGPVDATKTLTLLTYQSAFQTLQFGLASALGSLVFLIAALFATALLVTTRSRRAATT